VKLCKVYSLKDALDPDPLWQELQLELCPDWKKNGAIHRKHWEWGLGLYGLQKLGCIRPDAEALSVGAGVEWPLYYFANRVRHVHAIDLYDDTHFEGLDPTVPSNAERAAPFPYRREALSFTRMDALDLQFPDDTFDFVFTFSSIEHFGGHGGTALAMQEIARVLKPGGVAVVSTEIVLHGRDPEFFTADEIAPCFVDASGLTLVEPLDLAIDPELVANPVPFDYPPGFQGDTGPHTSVRIRGVTFTSIELFLRKPADWRPAARSRRVAFEARRRLWDWRERARHYAWRQRARAYRWGYALPRYVPRAIRRPLKKVYARVSGRPQ
jgi:SAM-dependent methyltransferase